MSENIGNKKRSPSKKPSNGKKSGNRPKRPRPSGASSAKSAEAGVKKKNKLAGKTVEMSSGNQISIDEVIREPEAPPAEAVSEPKKTPVSLEKKPDTPVHTAGFEEDPGESSELNEQISWKKQISSIVIWMFSVILLALTFFPGESLWTVIHSFILGILGFKSFLDLAVRAS